MHALSDSPNARYRAFGLRLADGAEVTSPRFTFMRSNALARNGPTALCSADLAGFTLSSLYDPAR
jgi:hypothetical protein